VFLPPKWVKCPGERIRILRVSPLMREMVNEAMRWPINQPEDPTGRAYFKAFSLLCRDWITNDAQLHLPTTDDPRLKLAMDYTQEHLADTDFAQVCKAASLSERSLRRRFQGLIGMSWTEYRQRSRLIRAMTLLESRHRRIGNVAALVGFESASAFSSAFSLFVGESPRDYRERVAR
jgi:transcriptional regulator GlxA family with amidase domain